MKLASVPPGPDHVLTIPAMVEHMADSFGAQEFLVGPERRLTFAETADESARLALGLLALGVGKASHVAVLMPNSPDWVTSWLAAARVGAHTVALSTFYRGREIDWGLRHNDVHTLLVSASYLKNDYVEMLEEAVPGLAEQTGTELFLPQHPYLRHIVVWGECDRPWAIKGPEAMAERAAANPALTPDFLASVESNVVPADDLITICTSGSSAEPKAVVHTHATAIRATWGFLDYLDFHHADRTYSGQPFFWIGGLNINLFSCMHTGATLVFSATPQPDDILDVVQKEQVTRLSMWPAQIKGLRESAEREGRDMSFVRSGMRPRHDEYGDDIEPHRLVSGGGGCGLGMTESFGMHSMEKTTNVTPRGKDRNWGRHLPGMDRVVVDPATMQEVEAGVEGELYIRGHAMMRGYYKKEREEVFTRDGFFPTGDLVIIDEDDYLYFTGRVSEMIKTSGANVAPREVELVAQSYPDVREAVVVGLPDEVKGELVTCAVVPAGEAVDLDDLRARLRHDLSPYKVPAEFVVMAFEDVPRTGSAKPHKPNLKKIIADRLGRQL